MSAPTGRMDMSVEPVKTIEAAAATRALAIILANPNNPDGRETMRDDVFGFARAHRHRLLIIDEAFADLRQDLSMTGAAGSGAQSGGDAGPSASFFGLAGVRLGFVFAEPRLASILTERLGPWAALRPCAGNCSACVFPHRSGGGAAQKA